MKKIIIVLLSCFLATSLLAENRGFFSDLFKDKQGCFILENVDNGKVIEKYNEQLCSKRISPCSTFKIAIAVMGFDDGILKDKDHPVFKWDGTERRMKLWNMDQTPITWLKYSTVWVSQFIMQKIGMDKVKKYLSIFKYGNEDMSGGITKAWLDSSLKISAQEQIAFLNNLWNRKLDVSKEAMKKIISILPNEKLKNGAVLYYKTGSGDSKFPPYTLGWCVGFVTYKGSTYSFVLNYTDKGQEVSSPGGLIAKDIVEKIISKSLK